jgi:hypothetical protein
MSFTEFTSVELGIDKAIKSTTLYKINENLKWLRQAYQYNRHRVPNGEFDLVTNGVPNLWDCTTFEGGYCGISSSTSFTGKHSLMIVHDGTTRSGGKAVSDYIPVTTNAMDWYVEQYTWGDPVRLQVYVDFYLGDFTANGSSMIYNSTVRTASPGGGSATFQMAANTRWAKIRIMNSTAAADTGAGTVYVDKVRLFRWATDVTFD